MISGFLIGQILLFCPFMISGGEKKRLCIGIELVTCPSLLILDEPTTGLSSSDALSVMQIIQEMTKRRNITVLCSLHQPRTEIFKLFDQLLLMSIGRNMYFGPASEAGTYFTTLGFPCPLGFNLADWVLDITT